MKGNCGECERRWFCEIDSDKCDEWPDPLPMTNADRIRAMTDEELAEFIMYDFASDDYGTLVHDKVLFFTVNDLIAWLQQPCGGADHA